MSPGEGRALDAPAEPTLEAFLRAHAPGVLFCVLGGGLLFWPAIRELVGVWASDPNFSHGFLVPAIAAFSLHSRRRQIAVLPARKSLAGLAVLVASLIAFAAGHLTLTNFPRNLGLWGACTGGAAFLCGLKLLRAQPFPFFVLLLAIPPPLILFSPFANGLRGIATELAAASLRLAGVPCLTQGSILSFSGGLEVEVADACSGIRSLLSIVLVAVLLAHLLRSGFWKGCLLTLTAVPITVLVNVLRIDLVSVALVKWGLDLTEGWVHTALGIAVFLASLVLLYASWRLYSRVFGWQKSEAHS
jgi:exosortase